MKITENSLVSFIEVKEQGRIPIFQREYSWTEENCIRLVEDIIRIGESENTKKCHFLGSIIYEAEGREDGVLIRSIIDGQQRLTTISLLILALLEYCNETSNLSHITESMIKQFNGYLYNDASREDLKNKLLFNNDSDFEYQKLMQKGEYDHGTKYAINYRTILEYVKNRGIDPKVYLDGITRLKIVDILVEENDDAHLIFETVNGTGLELTGAQLIKNYILMTVPPAKQSNLYTDSWRPMELNLGNEFDAFFRYYLIAVKMHDIEKNPKSCYKEFKTYANNKGLATEDLVRDEICRYYHCYTRWKSADRYSKNDLDKALWKLKYLRNDVITPVVLFLLFKVEELNKKGNKNPSKKSIKDIKDLEKNIITILDPIESYFARFKLAGKDSKNVGDIWLKMLKQLNKKSDVDSIYLVLKEAKNTQQSMPTDSEVQNHLKTFPIYDKQSRWCRYVLDRIEMQKNKEYTHNTRVSVEHILPQTPKSQEDLDKMNKRDKEKYDWRTPLGNKMEEAMEYVHTLGNLTLSGYNSELQNYYFIEKRDMKNGYKDSKIKITNELIKYDKWDKKTIIKRTGTLEKTLLEKVWKYPAIINKP